MYRRDGAGSASTAPLADLRTWTPDQLAAQLASDLGGDPSAAQLVLIDLAVKAKLKHQVVSSYLNTLEVPWVDRRSHRAWRLVHDLAKLERHVARLIQAVMNPALARRAAPVMDLHEYIARHDTAATPPDTTPDTQAEP